MKHRRPVLKLRVIAESAHPQDISRLVKGICHMLRSVRIRPNGYDLSAQFTKTRKNVRVGIAEAEPVFDSARVFLPQ